MTTRIDLRQLGLPLAFVLGCVVLTLAAFHVFGGTLPLEAKGYRVSVRLPNAENLLRGSQVQASGVPIGRVVAVRREGNGAMATLEIRSKYAPLRADVRAIARSKTLLGEAYLELTPGAADAGRIPDGGRIAAANVDRSVQLDEFLSTFDARARRGLRSLFAGLSRGVGQRGQQLNASLGLAAPVTTDFATIFRTLDEERTALSSAVAHSAGVLTTLARRQGDLQAAIVSGNHLVRTTARRSEDISAVLAALAPFLREARRAGGALRAAGPELRRAARALLPVAPALTAAVRGVSHDGPAIRRAFSELTPTLGSAREHLPALTPILAAARKGFAGFYPASREVIPFMQLAALNRDSITAFFANIASSLGKYVGPGGVVGSYINGLPTVWNETIGGWKHKLPTNRQNPYPKSPDALLDTGRIGAIKSYDCRNTGNPLILPPTGNGAPPCRLQGPWSFDGRTAYYPRLQPAAP